MEPEPVRHKSAKNDIGLRQEMIRAEADASGLLEIFGRQDACESWIFGGWFSRAGFDQGSASVTAAFDRATISGDAFMAFYDRDDLSNGGTGFVIIVPAPQRRLGRIKQIEFNLPGGSVQIGAAADMRELQGKALSDRGQAIVSACHPNPMLAHMASLVARRFLGEGYIDAYGYHLPSAGWFVCGWVSNDWVAGAEGPTEIVAHFETGQVTGVAVTAFYEREDLRDEGVGFVAHLGVAGRDLGRLLLLTLRAGHAVVVTRAAVGLAMVPAEATADSFRSLIAASDDGLERDQLRDLVARVTHDGRDTIASLSDQIFLEFDEVIACAPDSIVLIGWMLARPGVITAMRLRSKDHVFPIDMERYFLWTDRNDVLDSLGREHGFDDSRCGFIARVPTPHSAEGPLYLEVETGAGEMGFKNLPRPRLEAVPAIKRLLGGFDAQYMDVDALYDNILGPALSALNTARLQTGPRINTLRFGPEISAPFVSVIIPLYGRIDFMELQMALFATLGLGEDVELLYVLDDPPKTRDAQFLAASLYARFRVPFKLLCLSRNMGFAPANAAGLQASAGRFVCFMNSDVFPTTGDWLTRLAAHLEADAELGVVGPVLMFEDDSVQHQGIFFKSLPQFGNWAFAHHTRKGFRVPEHGGLVRQDAITGACMLLRRESALPFGGFDEAYIIGDFEDTDLCFKLAAVGQGAAVDFGVAMYHLERKSQTGSQSAWRSNLTLYNAWIHQRRWAEAISRLQTPA